MDIKLRALVSVMEFKQIMDTPEIWNHKSMSGRMFTEGTTVEVSFLKENHDVWHVGTVIGVTGTNKCLVKYHCHGHGNEHNVQEFDYIRPSPPRLENDDFGLEKEVEVYFECCWWTGVILKLLADRTCLIFLKHAKTEMIFDHTKLRPHMVWTDDIWFNEAKVKTRPGMPTRQSENLNRLKTRAEKQQSGNACASTGINISLNIIVTIHNFHTTLNDDTEKKDITGVHFEEFVNKECLTEEVDKSVKEVKFARSAENSEITWRKDQKKQSKDQDIHTVDSIKGSTEGNNSAKRKRGRPKMLSKKQIGERSTEAKLDMKDFCVGDEAKSNAENNVVMSTTINEMPKSGDIQPSSKECLLVSRFPTKLRSGVCRHNDVLSRTENIHLPEDQAGETVLSKRVNGPKNSVSNGHGELSRTVDRESGYQDMMIDGVGDTNVDQTLSMRLNMLPPIGSNDPRALSVGSQDGSGTSSLKQENTMESSPLQKTDGPRDLPVKSLNQCAESNKGGELGTLAIVSIDTAKNEESFPFVKRTPVWECFDSMEIFKKMPQKPHFSPLYEHMEVDREGLATAHMVKFANLVDNTLNLKFSTEIAVIERGLKGLAELKSHGFHVEKVEACLTQLLFNKQRAEVLQKEYDNIRSEMKINVDEGQLLDEEIRQLEKKLDEAKLKEETREKALSALQSKGDAVGKNVQSLEVNFESIVGSLYD